ncbi:endonuclease domain-containing protein, partial [Patescibacteria group bacterium]|nr:endonuclease domain-containing protein [Patescibacteria group bacterium]
MRTPPLIRVPHLTPPPDKGRLGGVYPYIPYKRKLKEYARQNRKNPTQAEQKMWNILRREQFKRYKFTRQKPLDTFIADFYCAQLLLVIEIDGDTHAQQEEYDALRSD